MYKMAFVRDNVEAIRDALRRKGITDINLDDLLFRDDEHRRTVTTLGELRAMRKTNRDVVVGRTIRDRIANLEVEVKRQEQKIDSVLMRLPQIPAVDVPDGVTDADNVEVRRWPTTPLSTNPDWLRDHVDILNAHGWADLDRIAKVVGARQYALKGAAVRLESAIHRMAWDKLEAEGFTLITVPNLVPERLLVNTGQGTKDVFETVDGDYLSGTAEVVLTSLHGDEILDESQLPILYAGYSPCFREEAGSAGRDTRGLMRVHQFNKTEQFVICKDDPEESERWHAKLLEVSEWVMQQLELPYRVMAVCTGDMGLGKYRMHDIEAWVPSLGTYRETHSCSSFHAWQTTRANIRWRSGKKVRPTFTLNNTAVATPRLLVPFLETHQQEDGTIRVPEALRPYLGGVSVLGQHVVEGEGR